MEFQKFDELEERINVLIADYALLKQKNQELEDLLQQKATELEEANKKMGRYREDRDAVHAKADALLGLLHKLQEIKIP